MLSRTVALFLTIIVLVAPLAAMGDDMGVQLKGTDIVKP